MLFFQAPNQRNTSFKSWARAAAINASTELQSNCPSCGSINSHDTGVSTVLRCIAFRRAQCGAMYAALEALELPTSPARTNMGRPFTTRRMAVPCFSRDGGAATATQEMAHNET